MGKITFYRLKTGKSPVEMFFDSLTDTQFEKIAFALDPIEQIDIVPQKYLLDTNVMSECVKTTPNASVLHKLEKHGHEIVTAAPVWHELQYGCHRLPGSGKRRIIDSFLNDVVRQNLLILPYDGRAAEWHAKERSRLSSKGRTPPFVDGQIAAIAKVNRLVLVSGNVEDYKPFSGIETENWHRL